MNWLLENDRLTLKGMNVSPIIITYLSESDLYLTWIKLSWY